MIIRRLFGRNINVVVITVAAFLGLLMLYLVAIDSRRLLESDDHTELLPDKHIVSLAHSLNERAETPPEQQATEKETFLPSKSSLSIGPRLVERQLRRRRSVADVCSARLPLESTAWASGIRPWRNRKQLIDEDGLPVPIEFYFLLVDDERQILYCEVPKVACTNWKRTLIYLTGKTNVTSPDQLGEYDVHAKFGNTLLPRLHTYQPAEIQHRLNTYFKFMFVREPLDRLRSTYMDKFSHGTNSLFNDKYGRTIISNYRKNASNESLIRGGGVRHGEFIKYLIDPRSRNKAKMYPHSYGTDPHWRSYDDLCHPCFVGYDFIGKYETLSEDVEHVMKLLGTHGEARFPSSSSRQRSTRRSSALAMVTGASVIRGYEDVPVKDVQKLFALYQHDYTMFGYPHPPSLFPLTDTKFTDEQN